MVSIKWKGAKRSHEIAHHTGADRFTYAPHTPLTVTDTQRTRSHTCTFFSEMVLLAPKDSAPRLPSRCNGSIDNVLTQHSSAAHGDVAQVFSFFNDLLSVVHVSSLKSTHVASSRDQCKLTEEIYSTIGPTRLSFDVRLTRK